MSLAIFFIFFCLSLSAIFIKSIKYKSLLFLDTLYDEIFVSCERREGRVHYMDAIYSNSEQVFCTS